MICQELPVRPFGQDDLIEPPQLVGYLAAGFHALALPLDVWLLLGLAPSDPRHHTLQQAAGHLSLEHRHKAVVIELGES